MFVDVNRFELNNDGLGHGAGNSILVLLGERLTAYVRGGDPAGLFGGDGFVIVCDNLTLRGGRPLAERIRHFTRRPLESMGGKYTSTSALASQ